MELLSRLYDCMIANHFKIDDYPKCFEGWQFTPHSVQLSSSSAYAMHHEMRMCILSETLSNSVVRLQKRSSRGAFGELGHVGDLL